MAAIVFARISLMALLATLETAFATDWIDPRITHHQAQRILGAKTLRRCIQRELLDFNDQFDAVEYKNTVFAEAGITEEQLKAAYKDPEDQSGIHQAMMEALQQRAPELKEVAWIITACKEEDAGGPSAVGIGAMVGAHLAQAMEEGPLPPSNTTISEQGSDSDAGDGSQEGDIIVGYHLEGGIVFDLSLSSFFTYNRYCGGLELGGGGEAAIIVLMADIGLPQVDDSSAFFEIDGGLGLSVGAAIGSYQNAAAMVFEITIGAGLGFGAGFSYCVDQTFEE